MAEQQDPLSTFDFDQVTTAGLYLKFSPGILGKNCSNTNN